MMENAFQAYQLAAARGASPLGQVIALYDTILRDFSRADDAIQTGNVEARTFELNHALTVIAHLRGVLDHERGGDAAKRLERFYDITRAMVLQANMNSGRETLRKLTELYSSVRQAWQDAERQLAASDSPRNPAAPAASPQPASSQNAAPAASSTPIRGNWSA